MAQVSFMIRNDIRIRTQIRAKAVFQFKLTFFRIKEVDLCDGFKGIHILLFFTRISDNPRNDQVLVTATGQIHEFDMQQTPFE